MLSISSWIANKDVLEVKQISCCGHHYFFIGAKTIDCFLKMFLCSCTDKLEGLKTFPCFLTKFLCSCTDIASRSQEGYFRSRCIGSFSTPALMAAIPRNIGVPFIEQPQILTIYQCRFSNYSFKSNFEIFLFFKKYIYIIFEQLLRLKQKFPKVLKIG